MRAILIILFLSLVLHSENFDFFDKDEDQTRESTTKEQNATHKEDGNSPFKTNIELIHKSDLEGEDDSQNITFNQTFSDARLHIDYDVSSDLDDYRVNIKEAYIKSKLSSNIFFDIGRINIREGISLGYNATDYFKGGGINFDSLATSDRQGNRLGSLLAQGTLFSDNYTLKLIYSPKINTDPDAFWSDKEHIGLGLDTTNYTHRYGIDLDVKLFKSLSSSFALHNNEEGWHFGSRLSYAEEGWILYSENSIKKSYSSVSKAISELEFSDTLKENFDIDKKYIYQGSLGASYTTENNTAISLEYIYNSGGLDEDGWNRYFELSSISAGLERQLSAVRKYHKVNEEMMGKHTLFGRISINDIFLNTDFSFFSFVDLSDGSSMSRATVKYDYNEDIIFEASITKMFGEDQSEYGSLDDDTIATAKVTYHF
ncbi:MAG: hypothetical protein HF962_00930 [Sulfurovum sp.]|nr:hypothetical protein [Sulfurovum sp.]